MPSRGLAARQPADLPPDERFHRLCARRRSQKGAERLRAHGLPERIFISRADFADDGNRLLLNHEAVTKAVADSGLTAGDAGSGCHGRNSWQCFSRAKIVAGEYGSGLHNAMFGRTGLHFHRVRQPEMNWTQSSSRAGADPTLRPRAPAMATASENRLRRYLMTMR